MRLWIGVCSLGLVAYAQTPPSTQKLARIDGQVINDSDGAPLRRARVTLQPLETGMQAVGAEADDKGYFSLRDIAPGTYSITAQRDGYLTTTTAMRGSLRMPARFSL